MRGLVITLAVACGGAPPPAAPIAHHVAVAPPAAPRIFRQLALGRASAHAKRVTFSLAIEADTVTLVQLDELLAETHTLADLPREAPWTTRAAVTYRGTQAHDGSALLFDLAAEGVQPLNLRCEARPIEVAAAGAVLVRPEQAAEACADHGVWQPATTAKLDALVCVEASHPVDEGDDDDRLVFAASPGIEWAHENDGCALKAGGLRAATR